MKIGTRPSHRVILKAADGYFSFSSRAVDPVTDRQIRSQSECCRASVAQIYRADGAKVKCGKCVPTAKSIGGLRPQAPDDASIPDFDGLQLAAVTPRRFPPSLWPRARNYPP